MAAKPSYTLGLCYGGQHDSSAALLKDGVPTTLFAGNGRGFPHEAIRQCLSVAHIAIEDVAHAAFFWQPWRGIGLRTQYALRGLPRSLPRSSGNARVLFDLLTAEHTFRKNTGFRGTFHFVDHTLAHAAHAFYDSGFQEAAILTLDGTGETKTCWIGESNGDKFIEHRSVLWPHSLGHVYAAITEYLGYESFKEEGLVMQLSQEGVPEHLEKFRKIIQDKDELFEIDLSYFGYPYSQPQRFSSRLAKEFGPARLPTEAVNERHKNIAASLQARLEEIVLKLARYAVRTSGKSALCLAGGVMHNSLAVEKLRQSGIAENIHVPSHPGDIGTALGAALLLHHAHHEV